MKRRKIIFSLLTLIVISFMIGFSFAYFTTSTIGNNLAGTHDLNSGGLELKYNGTEKIKLENAEPGDYDIVIFTVKNIGTVPIPSYSVNLSSLKNTFINNEVVFSITCVSSDANPCIGKSEAPAPTNEQELFVQGSININTTHTYTLTVKFIEMGHLQDYNVGKELSFKITINELEKHLNYIVEASINDIGFINTKGYFWDYKEDITSITFEDEINIPVNNIHSWDISKLENGSIMAYIIDDGLGNGTYKLYIQSNDKIYANPNSKMFFFRFTSLKQINNFHLFNTDEVINMHQMFSSCRELEELNLNSFNTSKVTDMSSMFYQAEKLVNLNIESFNTSKVTNMHGIFSSCHSLVELNLINFNTYQVTNMSAMFANCSNLNVLNLNGFDTSNVTDMSQMFADYSSSAIIDFSTFDTRNVTTMEGMFADYSSSTPLNLSNLDTRNVIDMSYMFSRYNSNALLEVGSFNIRKVINMSYMFSGYEGTKMLDLSGFNTSNVKIMRNMFAYYRGPSSINLSGLDTSNVEDMYQMFAYSSTLTSVDLSNFDTSNVVYMEGMFYSSQNLLTINLSNHDFSKPISSYESMFYQIQKNKIITKDSVAQAYIDNSSNWEILSKEASGGGMA